MLEILSLVANLSFYVIAQNNFVDPGTKGTVYVAAVLNPGGDPAQNAVLHMPLPPRSEIVSITAPAGWTCSPASGEIVCTNPLMRSTDATRIERDTFRFEINLPADPDGLWFGALATLSSDTPQQHPGPVQDVVQAMVRRTFAVTTTADSGAGSLRDTLVRIAQRCLDEEPQCKLTFDLPPLSRIEPLTPLPPVAAHNLVIAGDKTMTSDRAVELSGRLLQSGSGLTFTVAGNGEPGYYDVAGLAIGDFPDYGITTSPGPMSLEVAGVFVGTDATGTLARPNGRGLGFFGRGGTTLASSIVSGNRASGIWLSGGGQMLVDHSLIGAGRDLRPLGNGRSGIYAPDSQLRVQNSTVAYNGDAGIALGGAGIGWAAMSANRIFLNGTGGIDWGLDGPDPRTSEHSGPIITEASYDAAKNVTIVKGIMPRVTFDRLLNVEIFANHTRDAAGRVEGEIPAGYGTVTTPADPNAPLTFTATLNGDYRGQLLTATFSHGPYLDAQPVVTSEFSEPFLAGGHRRAVQK